MRKQKKSTSPFTNLLNRPIMIQLAVLVGKILPRKTGFKLADLVGNQLGKNSNSPMVKAIRANQWVINNQSLSEEKLNELPKIIFRSAARCFFDYFYFLSRPEKLTDVVDFSMEAKAAFERIWNNEPCVVVCPHLSNFDLMGYTLALHDLDVQVLSFPQPNTSYKLQNRLRESLGIYVTPMSLSAFRQARIRLKEGGSILTGLDRPLSGNLKEKYRPTFFGYESNLPVAYVRMAKEANAPVMVMAATSQPDGRYRLEGSDLIWMQSDEDLEKEILENAHRVLREAESIINNYAQQWAMFYPIWPQFLGV